MLGKNFAGVWPEAAGGTSPWKRAFLCPFAKSAVAPAYRELAEPMGEAPGDEGGLTGHPHGAPCGGLMGCYHSAAGTGAFSLQIPKYLCFFSSGARTLQSCCFLWLRRCHPHRAARCPCSADASLCVLIPDAQGPSQATGRRVNILTGVGTNSPEMPRAAWCRREALPGDAHAARWGWMPGPCLFFKGNLEAAR